MLAGRPYRPDDAELGEDRAANRRWLVRVNSSLAQCDDERSALLRERFAALGDASVVLPPFHCDSGYNIRIGERVFVNFGCTLLDVAAITIGDRTKVGPAMQLYTADHPRDASSRPRRTRIREADRHWRGRLDRRWRDRPSRRENPRWRDHRRRERREAGRPRRRNRCGQSGARARTLRRRRATPSACVRPMRSIDAAIPRR